MSTLAGYNFYLYTHTTDMRMGINGLSGIVRNIMEQDPLNRGVIYIFFNGRRTQVKMLVFEGYSHALYHKRFVWVTFGAPVSDQATQSVTLDKKDVMLVLEGVEIRYRKDMREKI